MIAEGNTPNVTASFGLHTSDLTMALKEEIAIADKCLYEAKNQGRNKTVSSEIVSINDFLSP